jgi:DNA topoisomerase-3
LRPQINRKEVCIAEKLYQQIASVLELPNAMDVTEGNGYAVTYGHLCTLKNLTITNLLEKLGLNNLPCFLTNLKPKWSRIQVFKAIQNHNLFDKASLVINCGDAGQEGELFSAG